MLYRTQAEIDLFFHHVIQLVAASNRVGVQDLEFKSTVELMDEISRSNPDVNKLLTEFLEKYQNWYDVHVKINAAGTAGNLTPQQRNALESAIYARDQTRSALLAAIQ